MSESNSGGRNQKLVIDYLEALLSDSDDVIIEIEQELAATVNREPERESLSRQSTEKQAVEESSIVHQHASQESEVPVAVPFTAETESLAVEIIAGDTKDEVVELSTELDVSGENMPLDAIADDLSVDHSTPNEHDRPESLVSNETETADLNSDQSAIETDIEADIEADIKADIEADIEAESAAEGQDLKGESAEHNTASMDSEPLKDEQLTAAEPDRGEPELESHTESSAVPEIEAQSSCDVELVSGVDQEMEVIPESQSVEPELSINCIIVLMYGLKLAIPFEDIEGLIKLSNVTLSLDNDRNWILGDFRSATMCTHIVDTAQILFGDNYDPLNSNYNEMLVLAGKHWSIVFDKIIKAQNIVLSDVTENPSPQFRPWLTGTYLPEKCALVNVAAMVKMFDEELNA